MIMTPEEMRKMAQWVGWRLEPDPKGEKPRKVPYDPKTGKRASSTNPETWGTMEQALEAKDRYMLAGIGFVFTDGCGIIGVDIDHCLDENGKMNEIARAITEKYPTYTEISPSGTGLHLFYHGTEMPGKGNKNSATGCEMYAGARYFTMTGKQLEGSPDEIRDGTEALKWIHENYIGKARKEKRKKARTRGYRMSDEELMTKAFLAENGEAFKKLYGGAWQERFGSQSEADLSLCCSLAFWSGRNAEQMDRLFRASGLFRPKWDEVHDAGGKTYGQKTLEAAIEHTEETYSPGGPAGIIESGGRYLREKGEDVYPITNFTIEPLELLECDEETQMTCEMATTYGERFRQVFLTADFASLQKFKAMLNRRTISLSFTGNENDLEMLKTYLSGLEWTRKRGVKASGLYHRDGRWLFADTTGTFSAGGEQDDSIIQMENAAVIESRVPRAAAATAEELKRVGPLLMKYNEPAKTVTVLAWVCGCYLKEILRGAGIKYPHLYLIGEAGSGKSTTMERIAQPLFGLSRVVAAPQATSFTLMKEAASSNLFPQALDEYKPSKIDKTRLAALSSHLRDSYDGHEAIRGRADQSQVKYELLSPLMLAGEEAPEEPSIRERGMELLFSKRDLKDFSAREAFAQLCGEEAALIRTGRLLLETALKMDTETIRTWHTEAQQLFNPEMPTRVINNLACCSAGLRLMETALEQRGLGWDEVFPLSVAACNQWLERGVKDYLLDGRTSNRTVVEQTLEIIDRMGLTDEECKFLQDGEVALYFKGFYDRFTRYIRENGITTEFLQFGQFMTQLRKSNLYLGTRCVRFASGDPKRAAILDYRAIQEVCDVEGFIQSRIAVL